ncbi:MAG: HAD-IIB family hydrolase [Gemmatimonadales bacterium]|nr:MAG: HAD-IIB family hydrolase [Gemmatimonadales bacterium]
MAAMSEETGRVPRLVIVTDLDGTLLRPRTYSFATAMPALALVKQKGIPLILCSSKTRAEIEVYRKRLDNLHPFVSENGGGIYVPEGYFPFRASDDDRGGYQVISLGLGYQEVRRRLIAIRDRLGIAVRGFGDMSGEEVAGLTGLTLEEARLARQRDFTEPFVFPDQPDERFLREIEADGLHWTQGTLFQIMGNHDKGKAVDILRKLYERQAGPITIVGIGDSLNDLQLLRAADRPVLVRKDTGRHDDRIDIPGLVRTDGIGPDGWNETVQELLQ